MEKVGQEPKEEVDIPQEERPPSQLGLGPGGQGVDNPLGAMLTHSSWLRPPVLGSSCCPCPSPPQALSIKMSHVLKVAPKSWQDHSSDFTVSLGPLPSLPYPAARPLRKPQLSHYGDPSAAWRQDGPFCQLTGAGTSQKQQCRPFPQGLIHAHKDPPRDLPSSARQSHYRAPRGAQEQAPMPSLP